MAMLRMGRFLACLGACLTAAHFPCGAEAPTPTSDQQRLAAEAMPLSGVLVDALAVDGNVVYVGWHCFGAAPDRGGIQAVDVRDPANPLLLNSLTPGRSPAALAVQNGILYVAWRPDQRGADGSAAKLSQVVEELRKGATVNSLTAAAAKGDNDEAEIYGVKDPANPKRLSGFPDAKNVECVAVSGEYAYLARRDALLIFATQDPSKPSLVGRLPIEGWIHDIKLRSNLAYLASNGLKIVDVSVPANPKLVGEYDSKGESWGVSLVNDRAYVPIEYLRRYLGRASVFDISNPAAPKLLDRFATGRGAWHVETSNNVVFVAGSEELNCYDTGRNCQPLGSYKPREIVGKLLAAGNRLYVADRYGFQVLDITEPGAPRLLGQYDIYSERERTEAMEKAKAAFQK